MTKPIKLNKLPKRVLTGFEWTELNQLLKSRKAALPAVCVSSTQTVNAALAAAAEANSPIIVLTSFGGGHAAGGKTLEASPAVWAAGAKTLAQHVHNMAEHYGVTVILSTDHCQRERIGWIDEMLKINQAHLDQTGQTLWSGHMIDASDEPIEESLPLYVEYAEKLGKLGLMLEIELGITGGEEDGVSHEINEKCYTNPEDVVIAYEALSKVSSLFCIAASFGNVHGVYKGSFALKPEILGKCQAALKEKFGVSADLVFHGGSGCTEGQMAEALKHGIIKQNIDTDTQWAFSGEGIVPFVWTYLHRLKSQIGYPEDPEARNKDFYDPRKMLFEAEKAMTKRLLQSFEWLNAKGLCD